MDWRNYAFILLALLPLAKCWTPIKPAAQQSVRQKRAVSPYIDIALCPIRQQPWSCAREQSARILDVWDDELHSQWQKLKVEADRQLNATIEKRGYSATEISTKEKPSTILKKIEIGTNFMKEYLAESFDGFLGHEYEYMQNKQAENDDEDDDADADNDNEALEEQPVEDDDDDDTDEDDEEQEDDDDEKSNNISNVANAHANANTNTYTAPNSNVYSSNNAFDADKSATADSLANSSNGDEFIEIADANPEQQLKQPLNKKTKKTKNQKLKKKGQKGQHLVAQPATLVVVQQEEPQHDAHHLQTSDSNFGGHGHKKGEKRKKRKKRPGHSDAVSTVIVEEAPSNHLGFELLEELVGEQQLFSGGSGTRKQKNKHPSKYGRSNGVTRGKKKKKRKAIAKLILLGTFLKAKIELLLKMLGAHLQIKFLAIAFIGLMINIARFWIDVKRGGVPQKVIYVEHAHHQHHYEDHSAPEDWSESGGGSGGYWKRSLQTDPTVEDKADSSYSDSYQPQKSQQLDAQYLAYRNQWH